MQSENSQHEEQQSENEKQQQPKEEKTVQPENSQPDEQQSENDKQQQLKKKYQNHYAWVFRILNKPFWQYVKEIINVPSDGHCGYWSVAEILGLVEENKWQRIRRGLLEELEHNRDIYGKGDYFHVERLKWEIDYFFPLAPRANYMLFPEAGHLIATRYNMMLHFFSESECLTFLPLRSSGSHPEIEGAVALVGEHFVMLILEPGCPVPPVALYWQENHDHSVNGWDAVIAERVAAYRGLTAIATQEDQTRVQID